MNVITDVIINRTKSKKLVAISIVEFLQGNWLDLVPESKFVEINYNARTGELHIGDLEEQIVKDNLKR